jgi:superfamily II DNA or RNA helicase
MPKPRFPKYKPADISTEDWLKLSSQPQCSNLIDCGSLCQPVDEDDYYDVDVHHIVSRARGGSSTFDNLRVLCRCRNQRYGPRHDPDFSGSYFFDREIHTGRLRQHQLELAYNIPQVGYRDLFRDDLALVLDKVLLFPWLMGAGKTIGVCAFLFAFNQLRAPFCARRARRVLWMVHQRQLVELLARELQTDPVRLGIVDVAPEVWAPESATMLTARPAADIVICCPQMFWDKEGRATLSAEERARILASFDAIVIDEAHFAIEQYIEILQAAPAALKIAVTATPMDADATFLCDVENGRYRDRFVVVSTFGYQQGRIAGFYKEIKPLEEGEAEGLYVAVRGGDAAIGFGENQRRETNTRRPLNVHRTSAVTEAAITKALELEQKSGHPATIIIRVDSKIKARELAAYINADPELRAHGAIAVYSGVTGSDQLNHPDNPWMRVTANGKLSAPPEGVRVLVCVDMGQFALNNRYCFVIAWRDGSLSLIEIIQRIGRAVRAIGSSTDGDGQTIALLWRDDPEFSTKLDRGLHYILNFDEELRRFKTLREISNPLPLHPDHDVPALLPKEKIELLSIAGSMPEGSTSEQIVAAFLGSHPGVEPPGAPSGTRAKAVEAFVTTVIRPPDEPEAKDKAKRGKARMLGGRLPAHGGHPDSSADPRIVYVQNEAPPSVYDKARLVLAVDEFPDLARNGDYWKAQIAADVAAIIASITDRLRARDDKAFRAPRHYWRASDIIAGNRKTKRSDGLLPPVSITKIFIDEKIQPALEPAKLEGRDYDKMFGLCVPVVYKAAQRLVGLNTFAETHPTIQKHHVQLADALLDPRNQSMIRAVALRLFIKWYGDLVPGLAKSFADVIDDLPDVDWRDAEAAD